MQSTIQQSNASDLPQAKQTQPIAQRKAQTELAQNLTTQAKTNQSSGIQSPQGLKPAIQAKQRPVQRQTKATYQSPQGQKPTIQAKQRPVQRQPKQDLKSQMGAQHGVDLSGFKEHQNSAFPSSVGALATIQGKDIHYAPGQFTEQNRKHELGHAIDNTLNGTPKGDQVVNGQNIDTTREKAADKIAETPIQRKQSPEVGNELAQPKEAPVVQRRTLGKATKGQAYQDRDYKRVKNNKVQNDKVGREDAKMEILQGFAFALQKLIEKNTGYDVGPHIAVSVLQKTLYVAINTTIKNQNNAVPTKTLQDQTLILVKQWEQLNNGLMFYTDKTHAMDWLVKAGKTKIKAFGKGNEVDNRSLHGEMRILKHIVDNNIQPKDKHKGYGDYKKVIRLGGTQLDCSDCHQMEHGGMDGWGDSVHENQHDGRDSFDKILGQRGFQVLSPGTHGAAFNGWVHPTINDKKNRYPGKVNNDIKPLGNKLLGGLYRDKKMSDHMKQEQLPILRSEIQFADQRLGGTTKLPNNKLTVEQQHNQMVASLKNNLYPKLEKKILAYKSTISQYEQQLGITVQQNDQMNICRRFDYYKAQAESLKNKTDGFIKQVVALHNKVVLLDNDNNNTAPDLEGDDVRTLLKSIQDILQQYTQDSPYQRAKQSIRGFEQQIQGANKQKLNIRSRNFLTQQLAQTQQLKKQYVKQLKKMKAQQKQQQQQNNYGYNNQWQNNYSYGNGYRQNNSSYNRYNNRQQNSYYPSNFNNPQALKTKQSQIGKLNKQIKDTNHELSILPQPTSNIQQLNVQIQQLAQQIQQKQQYLQPFNDCVDGASKLFKALQNYELQLAKM